MPTTKRPSTARRNIQKAAGSAKARKSLRKLPKKAGTSAGRQASTVKRGAKQVLFVQGGGGTHDSWDDKLVASLEQARAG